MYIEESLSKVIDLENALNNCNECLKYFELTQNGIEVSHYFDICEKLKKELVTAKKAHNNSKDGLVCSC